MLSAGRTMCSSGVSTRVTGTDLPSTVTAGTPNSSSRSFNAFWAHSRNAVSFVPFPSNVLHSTADAATNILVPGFTVHDLGRVQVGVPQQALARRISFLPRAFPACQRISAWVPVMGR